MTKNGSYLKYYEYDANALFSAVSLRYSFELIDFSIWEKSFICL